MGDAYGYVQVTGVERMKELVEDAFRAGRELRTYQQMHALPTGQVVGSYKAPTKAKARDWSGPFRWKLNIDASGMLPAFYGVGAIEGALTKDRSTLAMPSNIYGQHVLNTFYTQGAAGGRTWQNLSEMTLEARRRRGVEDQPILVQTGWLRSVAVKPFLQFAGSRGTGLTRSPIAVGGGITRVESDENPEGISYMTFSVSENPLNITAKITGPKAEHQYGAKISAGKGQSFRDKRGRFTTRMLPPRPFWTMPSSVVSQMEAAVVNSAFFRWADADKKLTGYSGVSYAGFRRAGALLVRKVNKQRVRNYNLTRVDAESVDWNQS